MSDDTYYTILNVRETASSAEIKTAYRDLIRQVHPDTIANLGPYLRKIAGEKAKEINEAYSILSDSGKRRDYDRQLAEYRRQNASQAPPPPPPQQPSSQATGTSSGLYCNRCGTALQPSGFCPKCNSFAGAGKWPRAARWIGYGVALLVRWSRTHPLLFSFALGAVFLF